MRETTLDPAPTSPQAASERSVATSDSRAGWSLALLLAINLFNYIDRQVLASVVTEIQREFGASDAATGMLATMFLVSYMCFAPLFGWLADRFSRWVLIGVGVILWSLASGVSGLATGIGMMLAARAFVGIGEAAYGPAAPAILADLYPIERRGRILAWFYAAIPVGSALGYMLGGAVLRAGLTWHWAFFVVVPPGILLGILALLKGDPRHSRRGPAAPLHHRHIFSPYRGLLRIPSYVFNTAGMTAMTFALGGIAFWMPKYIVWRQVQAGALDPADNAAVIAATAHANELFGPIVVVSGLLGTLAGGWAGDALRGRLPGSYFLVSGGAMMVAFPLVLLLPIIPFPAAWVLIFAACFCLFFNTGPTNTILANVTHPSVRAAGFALNIFIIHALGDVISPPLIGAISTFFGEASSATLLESSFGQGVFSGNMNAGFLAVSGTILLAGVFWLCGARYLERDTVRPAGEPL